MVPEKVLNNFAFKYQVSSSESARIFNKLEYFLSDANSNRLRPTKEIDQAWHTFILHTQEYAKYCLERFGRFIHHVPDDMDISEACNVESGSRCSANCHRLY